MESIDRVFSRMKEINDSINAMNQYGRPPKETSPTDAADASKTDNSPKNADVKNIEAKDDFSKELNSKIALLSKGKANETNETLKEGTPYKDLIHAASKKYGVSPYLVNSIITQESNNDPYAVSDKGALGLMQLLPSTAKEMGVEHVFSPKENIEGGSKYLSQLLNAYGGDLVKALAAYNAGSSNVDSKKAFNFDETNLYVKKVIANYMKNIGG